VKANIDLASRSILIGSDFDLFFHSCLIDNTKAPSRFTIFGTGADLTQALIYD